MTEAPRDYNIQALDTALQVLEVFLQPGHGALSLAEISQQLGLNKSRVFRILATLEQRGFVEQDRETHVYRLGLKLLALGAAVQRRLDLTRLARHWLDDLAAATGEAVFLGVLDGLEAVCVDSRESKHPIRLYAEVGRRTPLHVGGFPKVLLAYLVETDPTVLDRLDLTPITPATLTTPHALAVELAGIRRDGYVVASNDLDWGACSIAAPICDHTGAVVAALSVAGPVERFTPDRITAYLDHVRQAAAGISAQLGYPPLAPVLSLALVNRPTVHPVD